LRESSAASDRHYPIMSLRVDAPEFTPSFKVPCTEDQPSMGFYYMDHSGRVIYYTPPSLPKRDGPKIQYSQDLLLQMRKMDAAPPIDAEWLHELDLDIEADVQEEEEQQATTVRVLIPVAVQPKPSRRNAPNLRPARGNKSAQNKENKERNAKERALLHKSANRWSPAQCASDSDKATKNVTSLLNKLSASNLARLVESFVSLVLHASILHRAVELVFEKAVGEPGFSHLYAKFSRAAGALWAKEKSGEEDFTELMRSKVGENEAELFVDFDKKRAIGISKFVGDLFNVDFVGAQVVHDRIFGMFSIIDQESPDEHHVELLCKFISTVGKQLEKADEQAVERYFDVLEMIMANRAIAPRARFMIMDLQELRANRWTPLAVKKPTKTPSDACSLATTVSASSSQPLSDDDAEPPAPKPAPLTAEQVDKKATAMLAEFFSSQDLSEMLTCLKELNAQAMMAEIIYKAITMGLDRKAIDRTLVVSMLNASGEAGIFSTDELQHGFMNVLEMIEDLEIDIPHASGMVSSMLGGVMSKKLVPLSFLDRALPFFPPSEQPSVRILDVLSAVQKATDDANVRALYDESADQWSVRQYLQEEDIQGSALLQLIC